jgi:hypothetical protein
MEPKILIIGNTIKDCINISQLFDNYAKFVDYDTNIINIFDNHYPNYDIIIFDINEDIIDENFINNFNKNNNFNNLKILLTYDINENNLNKLMRCEFDMVVPKELDQNKVELIINIYNIINKYRND